RRAFTSLLCSALIAGAALQVRAESELQVRTESELSISIPSISTAPLFTFATTPEAKTLPVDKQEIIATLVQPLTKKPIALESPAPIQVAAVPGADRDENILPRSKQATIAAVTVPEVSPKIRLAVAPKYPAFARQARVQGMVYARVLVDRNGKVVRVASVEGQSIFKKAVEKAAQKWEFYPAMQGTLAVRTWVTLPFSFEL
ncbi:MAG: TonB family protein, partial [Gemmatimonadetes bacterium]|nr:TonB family protein [Gemmatimonadota bacterium]